MTIRHIAFIGLGDMGHWMALHLANKRASDAENIVAFDIDPERVKGLVAPGLVATTDPKKIAGAEVLFLCLPDGDVVENALFGANNVAATLADGAVVVDLSTIAHAKALEQQHLVDASRSDGCRARGRPSRRRQRCSRKPSSHDPMSSKIGPRDMIRDAQRLGGDRQRRVHRRRSRQERRIDNEQIGVIKGAAERIER